VIMGIRPQHLAVCAAGTPDVLTGEIVTVEFMGHEINLHVRIGDETIVAVAPTEVLRARPARGDRIGLRPDGHRMHIFDAGSEQNVSLAGLH
jgi:oligogalacturonide transport system ATP-binding protein